jgi:hypothetical protein
LLDVGHCYAWQAQGQDLGTVFAGILKCWQDAPQYLLASHYTGAVVKRLLSAHCHVHLYVMLMATIFGAAMLQVHSDGLVLTASACYDHAPKNFISTPLS